MPPDVSVTDRSRSIRLQQIEIASPCTARWDDMSGDDRVRHCAQCDLNVYNFAAMTEKEVESLIDSTGGRLCGRIYKRRDGTILFNDCPVGLAAVRRRIVGMAATVVAGMLCIVTAVASAMTRARSEVGSNGSDARYSICEAEPLRSIARWTQKARPVYIFGGLVAPPPSTFGGDSGPGDVSPTPDGGE